MNEVGNTNAYKLSLGISEWKGPPGNVTVEGTIM
jgi:hypothetical protein